MKQLEILNEIEKILKNSLNFDSSETEVDSEETSDNLKTNKSRKKGPVKAIFDLIVSFFISVIKAPFQLIHEYIKKEIIALIRKEIKLYFWLIILFGVLLTVFIVFWVLISLALGLYFIELGNSNLNSILLVIAFQLIIFSMVSFIIYKVSKKVKSLKLLSKASN